MSNFTSRVAVFEAINNVLVVDYSDTCLHSPSVCETVSSWVENEIKFETL